MIKPVQKKVSPLKSNTVPVPFEWATNRRATVHSFNHLLENNIYNIIGEVECKNCGRKFEMSYDLREKFPPIKRFVQRNKKGMFDRAPKIWMCPILPRCEHCNSENSVTPVIAKKKKEINWLFLFLGQMIGCCKLKHLKYICKHTGNHRTGAKDRVLYYSYLAICKQLNPTGRFNH